MMNRTAVHDGSAQTCALGNGQLGGPIAAPASSLHHDASCVHVPKRREIVERRGKKPVALRRGGGNRRLAGTGKIQGEESDAPGGIRLAVGGDVFFARVESCDTE